MGGLPDNPLTDPQDRTWFGPHDRLFIDEEDIPLEFQPGPDHGKSCFITSVALSYVISHESSVVLGLGWCW
jgi:hypothetical protein